jgi:hypothetical protein
MHGINKGFESNSECLTLHRTWRLHRLLPAVKIKGRIAIITERFNLQKTKDLEFTKENYSKAFNRFSVLAKKNNSSKFYSIVFALPSRHLLFC